MKKFLVETYKHVLTPLSEDFAMMELAYTIARIIQIFPNVTVPPEEPDVTIGDERQTLLLVLSSEEGCKVSLAPA